MLFFGSRCERLCMMQFSLISLIPGLLRNLQDSAGPELDNYEKRLARPTSLRTSDRNSLLAYMGLPLQIFGKVGTPDLSPRYGGTDTLQGSLFGPYTPLQQLDILADFGTKSYIVGSTNSLLLQQRDRYSDILINLDDNTINITSSSLKQALNLSSADRRWIDFICQEVNDTWDDANPQRPKTMGYVGSEEFIRLQFEEYLTSLISSAKYHNHLLQHGQNPKMLLPHIEGDPSHDFNPDFVEAWSKTDNYRLWEANTDSHLFDVIDPKHPCAGGLTIDDVQRRIAQQVQDLHLDERFAVGREVLGRNLAAGREKASSVFNKLYADMEALREAQRRRAEEARAAQPNPAAGQNGTTGQSVGTKAGAYVSSWAAWAGEKRKAAGWGRGSGAAGTSNSPTPGAGGWGAGWKSVKNRNSQASQASEKEREVAMRDVAMSPRLSESTVRSDGSGEGMHRPLTQGSFNSSLGPDSPGRSEAGASPRKGGNGMDGGKDEEERNGDKL